MRTCMPFVGERTLRSADGVCRVGGADFITKEMADKLDLYAMYMNSLTATSAERVRIPPVMADDEAAIRAAAVCVSR